MCDVSAKAGMFSLISVSECYFHEQIYDFLICCWGEYLNYADNGPICRRTGIIFVVKAGPIWIIPDFSYFELEGISIT